MRLIQISGKGRVGKTTLAHLIAKKAFDLGYIPVMLPFAGPIKEEAERQGITKDSDSAGYREFCQNLGETKRKEDPDYWVVRTFEKIQEYMIKEIDNKRNNLTHYEYVIIQDDVRYMNELATGRDLVAFQIFLDSNGRKLIEEDAAWRNHESELMANEVESSFNKINSDYEALFDKVIDNSGNLKDLEDIVKDELSEWLEVGYLELEEYHEDSENSNS